MEFFLLANHALFGTKHLILIAISCLLCVGVFFLLKKKSFTLVCKTMFFVGLVSETIKIFYYTIANEETMGGILPRSDLPFHLCSIQILFFVFLCFGKSEKIKRYLLAFMRPSCLFGGIAAILIATTSSRNGGWILTAQYFGYHVMLVIFALYLYCSNEIKFDIRDYFNCLKFLVVLMFFSFYINSILYDGVSNINFMYVAGPPQEGLPFLNEESGWLVYILRYALLVVVCVSLSYIAPIITAVKGYFKKQQTTTETEQSEETAEEIALTQDKE